MTLTSLLGPSQPLWGQQTPTFSSNVNVVNVLATVRDKHGQIVNNLTKDDFKLEEDGHPQTIRYFAKDTDLPLTLGLLVDTSMSQRRVLEQERVASYAFLEHLMREDKDKAFVIHFDWDVELLQDPDLFASETKRRLGEAGQSGVSAKWWRRRLIRVGRPSPGRRHHAV